MIARVFLDVWHYRTNDRQDMVCSLGIMLWTQRGLMSTCLWLDNAPGPRYYFPLFSLRGLDDPRVPGLSMSYNNGAASWYICVSTLVSLCNVQSLSSVGFVDIIGVVTQCCSGVYCRRLTLLYYTISGSTNYRQGSYCRLTLLYKWSPGYSSTSDIIVQMIARICIEVLTQIPNYWTLLVYPVSLPELHCPGDEYS